MPFMDWTDTLSVGNADIDGDHKRLIDLINQLHDAMKSGKGSQIVGSVLNALVDYTQTHFAREETIMKSRVYPQYHAHKAEHDKFIKTIEEQKKKFSSGVAGISLDTMDFLRSWLVDHIMKIDQQLGKWLAANPAS